MRFRCSCFSRYEDDVVQDSFKFGDDKEIASLYRYHIFVTFHSLMCLQIVALSNNVLTLNKKALKKLPRGSLSTPTKQLKSKSSIVDSPY